MTPAEKTPVEPHPVGADISDAGQVEPVAGTGLLREVGRMADGRRITYYSLPRRRPDDSGAP